MKILIFGGKGWIGSQFTEILQSENIDFIYGESRVDNNDDLINEINNNNPTHIISFIGRTHGKIGDKVYPTIDYLETKGKLTENIRDNLYSPLLLAILCKEKNIHFTYLGIGCIFNYDDKHPFGEEINGYDETAIPNFFGSGYSVVKGYTDRLMHLFNDTTLNLRIRMPIIGEDNPRNFITKITTYEKICSVPNSMTVLPELLPLVFDMLKNKTVGTVNLTNPGLISHNEILELYKKYVDPNFTYTNFTIEEQKEILAGDRSNNYLDTNRLQEMYPNVMNIKDSMENLMKKYNLKQKSLLCWVPKKIIDTNIVNKLLDKSLKLNQFTNGGPNVKQLENYIREKFKIDNEKSVIVVTNGSVALHAVTSGIQYTENINIQWATQSFTFPPSAQSNLSSIKIIDIDSDGGLDLNQLDDTINGIIVTNIFGNIVDIGKYETFCRENNKFLIFDNAATAYTFYKGKICLNYGHGCTISFHHTKPFGFGEGGAIIVDKKYEHNIRCLNNFGIGLTEKYWVSEGNNNKMSEISAIYILQFLMTNFDNIIKKHNELYEYFKTKIEKNNINHYRLFPNYYSDITVPSCFCILFNNYDDNTRLKLLENNIYCRKYYNPLKKTKIACEIYDKILCIPCTTEMTNNDIDNIFELIN